MAGAGSRFVQAGFIDPKPLIDVFGKPMIQWVIENLKPRIEHQFIFICLKEHNRIYNLQKKLTKLAPQSKIIEIDGLSQGAAETVLFATEFIDNQEPLIIANSDQFIEFNMDEFILNFKVKYMDGLILTMTANSPKWSYIKYNEAREVTEVREKEVISNEATVGVYAFSQGQDFVRAAHKMINKKMKVNGEFYVAPVYNELIAEGKKILFENIGLDSEQMNGLGTPEDLTQFLVKMEKCK